MDDQNREHLKELFATFFDAEQADRCAEDFRRGERILGDHPAPKPDDRLIATIKAEMARSLIRRRAKRFRQTLYEAAGIAAAMVILTMVGVRLFEKPETQPGYDIHTASLLPATIWESDDIAADDADLSVFTAEIEQIEYEIHALQSGEQTTEGESNVIELEIELEETNSDFWKG